MIKVNSDIKVIKKVKIKLGIYHNILSFAVEVIKAEVI